MGNSRYVGVVSVESTMRDGGYWVVKSEELPGLLLSGKVLPKLMADVPNVIKSLFKLNYGMDIEVRPVTEARYFGRGADITCVAKTTKSWAALPVSNMEAHA